VLSRVMNPAMAEKALHLLRNGYNVYEVAVKLTVDREVLVEYFKSDPELMEKATQARREGADALVATYKDLVMREIRLANDNRDRISLIKELGAHIRWEAQSVHSGTYATKVINEHAGTLEHKYNVRLTPEQMNAMAEEVLASEQGHDFADPRTKNNSQH